MDKILELMNKMTVEEKIGQLTQTGTSIYSKESNPVEANRESILKGEVGSFLSIAGADTLNAMQKIAVEETRLGIPLFFAHDILHGYRTIFPVPAGEACSFEPELAYESSKIAAREMRAAGIELTFAPMVDIARDQRWGRGMEGSGEDVLLSCEFAKARVKGFQNADLSSQEAVAACAKHFAGYGAVEGGREYNDVDMSENKLYNVHLPSFRACVDENVEFMMTSFTTLNGIPCTTNKQLLQDIGRKELGFDGIYISDAGSLRDIYQHGHAKDTYESAKLGIESGLDIEMGAFVYRPSLKAVLEDNKEYMKLLDESVYRVLKFKERLGLFENPYVDASKTESAMMLPEYVEAARNIAGRSMVLLENNGVLPLKKKKAAIIGSLADSKSVMIGRWVPAETDKAEEHAVTILEAFRNEEIIEAVSYAPAYRFVDDRPTLIENMRNDIYDLFSTDDALIHEALSAAEDADVILFVAGECNYMNGEAKSRADISVPEAEMKVFRKLCELKKPIISLVVSGRPLILNELKEKSDALIFTYNLGSQMGNAVADVIMGRYNPSAKLVNTFPHSNGQCPTAYYAQNSTGKPYGRASWYSTRYIDVDNEPLYPFGYGKSYTEFAYNELHTDKKTYSENDTIRLEVTLSNIGQFDGEEVVQVYMRDLFGKVVRPIKQLIDFKKVMLHKGESKQIRFEIPCKKLGYYYNKEWICEPGDFTLFCGGNSVDTLSTNIELV